MRKLLGLALIAAALAAALWWTLRPAPAPQPAAATAILAPPAAAPEAAAPGGATPAEAEAPAPAEGATGASAYFPADVAMDMAIGSTDAPVTIIEYASFTCPHCATFHATVWPRLKAEYIDTGKVRFIHREVYFDRFGLWAGLLARCGGEMRYFGIVDMIYDQQRDWLGSGDPATVADNLRRMGRVAGMSEEQVNACLNDRAAAEALVAAYQANAGRDGVTQTPTLFINGRKHSNMSFEDLARLIEAAVAD